MVGAKEKGNEKEENSGGGLIIFGIKMTDIELKIFGIKRLQAEEFLNDLRSIKEINKASDIKRLSGIEFKELAINILISFGVGIGSGLIAHYIIKFFEKQKSLDDKPIII